MKTTDKIRKQVRSQNEMAYSFLMIREIENNFEKGKFNNIDYYLKFASEAAIEYMLEWASYHGKSNIVKLCTDRDVNINANHGVALKMSAQNGHLNIVAFLIKTGIRLDLYGADALILAVEHNHMDIVKFLCKNKVNINKNDSEALRTALQNGNLDMVKLLLLYDIE